MVIKYRFCFSITAILLIILLNVFSEIKAFMGYRFNFNFQTKTTSRTLPDLFVLMILGSVSDYVQGTAKLYCLVSGKTSKI